MHFGSSIYISKAGFDISYRVEKNPDLQLLR